MKLFRLLLLFITLQVSAQQGGMWIPSLLEGMNENEMKALGSKLTAKDIYDVNNSSLKDATGSAASAQRISGLALHLFPLRVPAYGHLLRG